MQLFACAKVLQRWPLSLLLVVVHFQVARCGFFSLRFCLIDPMCAQPFAFHTPQYRLIDGCELELGFQIPCYILSKLVSFWKPAFPNIMFSPLTGTLEPHRGD